MNEKRNIGWQDEHPLILEDLQEVCSDSVIPWNDLHGKTIMITGATGLIGSYLVKTLLYHAVSTGCEMKILAIVRNPEKARNVFKNQLQYEGSLFAFVQADINEPLNIQQNVDYIVHAASVTSSQDFVCKPVDTIMTTLNGTRNVLELARKSSNCSVVFLSTLEIYGILDHERAAESDSGSLDPLSVRNSYPQSKRLSENLCVAYHAQYGVKTMIARLTQTFGPGVEKNDGRVFAQFARAVMEERDIVLLTKGGTRRDYLYTADAVRGILSILLLGNGGEAYNLSNPDSYMSILEMANMCKEISGKIDVKINIDEKVTQKYLGEIKITLDNSAINRLNNFKRRAVKDAFIRMIQSFS